MKRISIALLVLLIIISCTSEKEKLQNQTLKLIRKSIENDAFKQNVSVEVFTLDIIEMQKVGGHYLNQVYLSQLVNEVSKYNKLAEGEAEKIKLYTDAMNRLNAVQMQEKGLKSTIKINEYISKSTKLLDEVKKIERTIDGVEIDSLWKATVFVKATFKKNEEINNWLDTVEYIFNSKLEIQVFKKLK